MYQWGCSSSLTAAEIYERGVATSNKHVSLVALQHLPLVFACGVAVLIYFLLQASTPPDQVHQEALEFFEEYEVSDRIQTSLGVDMNAVQLVCTYLVRNL